jgi:hypothetical protein
MWPAVERQSRQPQEAAQLMLTFAILTCASAAYYAATFEMSLRFGEDHKTFLAQVIQIVAGLIPFIVCGVVQYRKLAQDGVVGARLWLGVTGTALGAPIAGMVLMLIVSFALFSKS